MNVLSKVRSDKRVVELKEAVDRGESNGRAEAKVASGVVGKRPPPPPSEIEAS